MTYATAEHYMLAEKAVLFGDQAAAARIVAAPSPGTAKVLGRRIGDFYEGTWEANRLDFVVAGNLAKFGQHEDLGR